MKYNDITVPPLIRTDRIISAFQNDIDHNKVAEYAQVMSAEMLSHDFPAIKGYPAIITEDDVDQIFMTGEDVTQNDIGNLVWFVTDGHHRTLAAIEASLPHLAVTLDYTCITSEEELKQFA